MTPDFPPPKPDPQAGQRIMAVFVSAPKCPGRITAVIRYGSEVGADGRQRLLHGPVNTFTVELDHERLGKRHWLLPAEQFKGQWGAAAALVGG